MSESDELPESTGVTVAETPPEAREEHQEIAEQVEANRADWERYCESLAQAGSRAEAQKEWEAFRSRHSGSDAGLEFLEIPLPDDEDDQEPAGDLGILADLGMSAMDMGALLDDFELWLERGGGNVGLVANYKAQFNKIVEKEGFNGLIARMKKKQSTAG